MLDPFGSIGVGDSRPDRLGRAAATGPRAVRKPPAAGRPRRADRHDRLRGAGADRVGRAFRALASWSDRPLQKEQPILVRTAGRSTSSISSTTSSGYVHDSRRRRPTEHDHLVSRSTTARRSPSVGPPAVDRETGQQSQTRRSTGSRATERSRISSSLRLQTGSTIAERADASVQARSGGPGPGHPRYCSASAVIDGIDRSGRAGFARRPDGSEAVMARDWSARPGSVVDPGRDRLAAGRAFGLSRREQAVWAVFVLLFGVPAFVGLLGSIVAGRSGVPCPHCQARFPATVATCAECGRALPGPGPQRNRDLRLK